MYRGCNTGEAGTEADPAELEDCDIRRAGGCGGGWCGGEGEYLNAMITANQSISIIHHHTRKLLPP